MTKDERRAAIVNAAVALVTEKGLAAATVRAVAAALGASPGQIHHHFASADDLRAEAFREAWRRIVADYLETQRGADLRTRLDGLIVGPEDAHIATIGHLWKDALAAARMSETVRLAVCEALGDWRHSIVEVLAAGRAEGVFPAAIEDERVAARLMALALGLDVFADIGFGASDHAGRVAVLREAIEVELRAAA
ncbi:TetR family transcriptional regulator [Acuticoccus kandeliae]|uniref:TetR family transcriptional regulator n=1 Tax=Acuticoccus kandeliae TaxID=2073160 RepID=UPI001FE468A8|nr:TetR family transcriptional regulator [Acuticoccus kandeliae]